MTPFTITLLFLLGLFFSAFFSGSETGFYRLNRIRLIFDARSGDKIAGLLLWLTNHPTLVVGATLVGNNLANYLTSFAIVAMVSQSHWDSRWSELGATVAMSPIVFVYGELLPKSAFFRAPNRLIRLGGPLMIVCVAIFAPVAGLLWAIGLALQRILGETPLQFRQSVARHELQQIFQEGHDVGLLMSSQQRLSRNLFGVASRPVRGFCAPPHQLLDTRLGEPKERLLEIAARRGLTSAPILDPVDGETWMGYVRIVDLYLNDSPTIDAIRPLPQVLSEESYLDALMYLQDQGEKMAQVLGPDGSPVGLVFAESLVEPLFRNR